MNAQVKRYPFSVQKHAHDIDFRCNRVANIIDDMRYGEIPWDAAEEQRLERLHDDLSDLLTAIMSSGDGSVAWLTGPQIQLAKETVAWAHETRSETMIRNGKTEYLKYV